GVSRFYWYAWDNKVMGLTEADGATLKPPARAYEEVEKWLLGAEMRRGASDAQGTWVSQIVRNAAYQAWIVWNPERTLQFEIPPSWRVKRLRDLAGGVRGLSQIKRM